MTLEVLEVRVEELEKRLEVHLKAISDAREIAAAGINERLQRMNEFRDQLDRQASTFITKQDHEKVEGRIGELEKFRATYEGRFWALGVVLGIAVAVFQTIAHIFWK